MFSNRLRRRGHRRGMAFGIFTFGRCFFAEGGAAAGGVAAGAGDGGAGGGAAGTTPTPTPAPGATTPTATPKPTPPADLIPRAEAQRAFASRDAAKAQMRTIVAAFGLDPDAVTVEPSGDAENPWKIVGEGVQEAIDAVAAARTNKQKGMSWQEKERQMQAAHQRQMQTLASQRTAERERLHNLIKSETVMPSLRAAFASAGAIDPAGDGTFADLLTLTQARVKVDIAAGEDDAAAPRVTITPLGEDGQPLLDGKTGKPVTVKQFAEQFLESRPHLRAANFRRGPGAGGRGAGAAGAGGSQVKPSGGDVAADWAFGKIPQR